MSHVLPRRIPVGILASAGIACSMFWALPASAADLDPGYADVPPAVEQQVNFGSGWYIRGDIAATRLPTMKINDAAYPQKPGDAIPTAPTTSLVTGSQLGYTGSIGFGYQINNWFRTDLIADFHEPLAVTNTTGNGKIFCPTGVSYPNQVGTNYGAPLYASGGCTATNSAKLSSYDILANGYIDLGTWSAVTPYIGAGVGVALGHYQTSSTYIQSNNAPYQVTYVDPQFGTFTQNYDRSSSANYYSFAWALMAGLGIDVYSHTKLDISYRYLNVGQIQGLSNKLTYQEVRAGVRYMIDN